MASDKELAEKIIGVLDEIRELTDSNPFKAEEDVSLEKVRPRPRTILRPPHNLTMH